MKMSKPSPNAMTEYLLYYGVEWIQEKYNLSYSEIDDILYGGSFPTEERQDVKKRRAFREDDNRKAYIDDMYKYDHFIWDKPNIKHIRCQNAEERHPIKWDNDFISNFIERYKNNVKLDLKRHGVVHGKCNYTVPSRVINKTTSKTKDDLIQDIFLKFLLNGKLYKESTTEFELSNKFEIDRIGHFYGDESFLENLSNVNIDNVKLATKVRDWKSNNTDNNF